MSSTPPLVQAHEEAGRHVHAGGRRYFLRDEGEGPPVLLLHGVPSSSFLYRKMLAPLAKRGLRAIAPDMLGIGLSEKPRDADYTWTGHAERLGELADALELEPVHLVVHDIAGPIGCQWAIEHPERVRSLTIMNTLLDVGEFSPPFPMWTYRVPLLRQVVFTTQNATLFTPLMHRIGVKHPERISHEEVAAWLWLLKHDAGRQPFLATMAGFELTDEHGDYLREGLQALDVPKQLVWGHHEIAIPIHQLDYIREHFDLEAQHFVDGRHFPQEDVPEACVKHIAAFALRH